MQPRGTKCFVVNPQAPPQPGSRIAGGQASPKRQAAGPWAALWRTESISRRQHPEVLNAGLSPPNVAASVKPPAPHPEENSGGQRGEAKSSPRTEGSQNRRLKLANQERAE